MSERPAAIVLAAGRGKRMRSRRAKVLHRLAGREMIRHVLDAVRASGVGRTVCVIGPRSDDIREVLSPLEGVEFTVQPEARGTGHAVQCAAETLVDFDGPVLVCCGDTPLLTSATLRALLEANLRTAEPATMLVAEVDEPAGYGRVVMRDGRVEHVVEEADADARQRRIHCINTGVYCFDWQLVAPLLDRIETDNAQNECYLTDIMKLLWDAGTPGGVHVIGDVDEARGINDRAQLAVAERVLRDRVRQSLMADGVTMVDPESTWIDVGVCVGPDTVLHPGVIIEGRSEIGAGCVIGPFSRLADATLGDRVELAGWNRVVGTSLADQARLPPHAERDGR